MPIIKFDHARLEHFTTFRLGGSCPMLIECHRPDELIQTVAELNKDNIPFILIGGGSNVVVSDQGLECAVIRYLSPSALIEQKGNTLTVSASTVLDELALYCVEHGLEGLNFTTGIPGTVGGAVVGNAGAWGKQVGDVLKSAQILERNGTTKQVDANYFAFSYRNSRLKESDEIILNVTFTLKKSDPVALAKERAEILKMRLDKHPDLNHFPCAGSFFRNIEPTSKADRRQAAGFFLEEAGGKNLKCGGAVIFPKHANIIIKSSSQCTAQDVHDLHLKMIDIVKNQFGLVLNREVRFAGPFKGTGESQQGFW